MWLILIISLACISGIFIAYRGDNLDAWIVGGVAGGCIAIALGVIGTYFLEDDGNFLEALRNGALLTSYTKNNSFYGLGYSLFIVALIAFVGKWIRKD